MKCFQCDVKSTATKFGMPSLVYDNLVPFDHKKCWKLLGCRRHQFCRYWTNFTCLDAVALNDRVSCGLFIQHLKMFSMTYSWLNHFLAILRLFFQSSKFLSFFRSAKKKEKKRKMPNVLLTSEMDLDSPSELDISSVNMTEDSYMLLFVWRLIHLGSSGVGRLLQV